MAAFGLYTHIRSNRRRSVVLLIGLFLLVYLLVYAGTLVAEVLLRGDAPLTVLLWGAWYNFKLAWPWATVGAIVWMAIAYKFHQNMIDAITGGHDVTREEEPRLYNLLENLCISRGIPMPKLKIIDDVALNAFATGLNEKQYSITVTTGLQQALTDAEMEAVLGHELTHIRNGDVRMLVIALVITGVVSFFGEMIFRIMFNSSGGRYGGGSSSGSSSGKKGGGGAGIAILIAIALIILAWVLAIVIRFALSRSREFLADAGAVELTKNPDAMIMALRKIEGRGELPRANSAVMEMCIDNPRTDFTDIFATHPSIDKRVDALVKLAGGHDPGPLALATTADEQAVGEEASAEQPEESPWSGVADQEGETTADRPSAPHPELEPLGRAAPEAGPWGRPRAPWGMRRRHLG
jgi:heat shock protein HtpX